MGFLQACNDTSYLARYDAILLWITVVQVPSGAVTKYRISLVDVRWP